jgi:hypothetical protein
VDRPFRLAEGEKPSLAGGARQRRCLRSEATASTTHAVKIYSEAEHHRAALAKAQELWEEIVWLLGDRLERLSRGD